MPWITAPVCKKCGVPVKEKGENTCPSICWRCAEKSFAFESGIAVFTYEQMRRSISHFKFSGNLSDGVAMAYIMAEYLHFFYADFIKKADIVMPIPMYEKKEKRRGFNQAKILAKELAQRIEKQYIENNLIRTRETTPQSKLNHQERTQNISGAFAVEDSSLIEDKCIVLVDDIFTTGSTINECAKELLKNGAKEVYFYTFSIVKHDDNEKQ